MSRNNLVLNIIDQHQFSVKIKWGKETLGGE